MAETDLSGLTAEVVTNYVAHNELTVADVPTLIAEVHNALRNLGQVAAPAEPEYEPAVTVRKSLADPLRILSMIDGKPYAMLTRHLRLHGLTPEEYRTRYKLPANYPMTAPGYSERRRELALASGLGKALKGKRAIKGSV